MSDQWRRLVAAKGTRAELAIVLVLAGTYLILLGLGSQRGLQIWLVIAVLAAVISPASGVALTAITLIPPEPNVVKLLPIGLFPIVAAAIGQLLRSYLRGRLVLLSLPAVSLVAFGLITLTSLLWVLTLTTPAPRAVPDWAVLITGIVACLVVASDPLLARWAPPFVFATGAAIASIGALAVVIPDLFAQGPFEWLIRQGVNGRAMGSTHNPNILGIVAGMSFAYFTIRAIGAKEARTRGVALLLAIASVPSLYFTFSRSAALGVGAAIIIGLLLLGRRSVLLIAVLLVGGAIALGPVFIANRLDTSSGRTGGNTEQQVTDAQASSDRQRIRAWTAGIRMVVDKPLTGVGFGRYPVVKRDYRGPAALNTPHSDYIRFFAETGIPGGTTFLVFVLGVAWSLKSGRSPHRVALAAALAAFCIATAFNAQLYFLESSFPFWVAAGAAIHRHDRPPWQAQAPSLETLGPSGSRPVTEVVRRHARPMPQSEVATPLSSRSAASAASASADEGPGRDNANSPRRPTPPPRQGAHQ